MTGDLFASALILVIFYLPSVLILSSVTVFAVNMSLNRKSDLVTPRTRLFHYWMVLALIRLFCLWQTTAYPEGAAYYVLGGPILPEIWAPVSRVSNVDLLLRAFVVFADSGLWAFLLTKILKRRLKEEMA